MSYLHEYLSRIESAYLDILENMEPTDKTITLWWGLDGLRMNQDGTTEFVSRKSQGKTVFYQPCQSIRPIQTGMAFTDQTQSTRARIDALMMQNAIQQCCVQYPAQYTPYYYGGCCGNYIG